MSDFPSLRIPQLVKSLPFHIPEARKRYPFWAEPHFRELGRSVTDKMKVLKELSQGTMMTKDGDDKHGLQTTNLKILAKQDAKTVI